MRVVRRLVHALILVLMLLVAATAAVVIVSQTSWFKNWLRGYIVREAGQYLRREGDSWSISRLIKKQQQEADRQGPMRPITIDFSY